MKVNLTCKCGQSAQFDDGDLSNSAAMEYASIWARRHVDCVSRGSEISADDLAAESVRHLLDWE